METETTRIKDLENAAQWALLTLRNYEKMLAEQPESATKYACTLQV